MKDALDLIFYGSMVSLFVGMVIAGIIGLVCLITVFIHETKEVLKK